MKIPFVLHCIIKARNTSLLSERTSCTLALVDLYHLAIRTFLLVHDPEAKRFHLFPRCHIKIELLVAFSQGQGRQQHQTCVHQY